MATVSLKGVGKRFGDVQAVSNFTLEIADTEFVIIVGPSGCGKTTVLRMIAGLETATEGDIYIGDRRVNDVSPKDRDIAMVFQNYALYPHMSVYNNMSFGLRLRRTPKADIDSRVREAAATLQIEDLLERRPRELSGGQRQRVALGRAIVRKPKVFLMDEPLSNLDAKLRVEMRASLAQLQARLGATTVYVTHDQVEAMTMGTRIVVMKDGLIQQVDTPLMLYNKPQSRFVAGFMGSPAMNFLPGRVKDARVVGQTFAAQPENELTLGLRAHEGEAVDLGLRPEDFTLEPETYGAPERNWVRVRVKLVEPVGSETILICESADQPITARLDAETKAQVGDELTLYADPKKVHVFAEDGHNVRFEPALQAAA